MKWSAAFATGLPVIDQQHQTLFKASEDYRSALDAGHGQRIYGALLEFLDGYARAHFGFEEQCMHRHQCPAADENAQAHREFVLRLGEFQNSFRASGFERQEEKADYAVRDGCRALGVSVSGFYAWQKRPPSAHTVRDQQLRVAIRTSHAESRGRYGRPRARRQFELPTGRSS